MNDTIIETTYTKSKIVPDVFVGYTPIDNSSYARETPYNKFYSYFYNKLTSDKHGVNSSDALFDETVLLNDISLKTIVY